MIIIDSELKKREAAGKLLRVGMIGAGFMGLGLANQIVNYTPGMTLTAIANRTVKHAHQAYENAGRDGVVEAQTLGTLEDAIRQGQPVITGNADWLCESEQIDILVEATGHVEFGAHVAMKAIACGKDMVLMNAELDGTVGPILQSPCRPGWGGADRLRRRSAGGADESLSLCDESGINPSGMRQYQGIARPLPDSGNPTGVCQGVGTNTGDGDEFCRWHQNLVRTGHRG